MEGVSPVYPECCVLRGIRRDKALINTSHRQAARSPVSGKLESKGRNS